MRTIFILAAYLDRSPEVLASMPGKINTSQPVAEEKESKSMPKGIQDHMDLATRAGDQLGGVDQGEGVAGVGAGHPAADGLQRIQHQ